MVYEDKHRYRRRRFWKEVQRLTGAKTKREAVDLALMELVARYRRLGLLKLKGKVHWEGDLEVSRSGRA